MWRQLLLEGADTVALWSLPLSDLFRFTGLSDLIAQRSVPPLVSPTRCSVRDEAAEYKVPGTGSQRSSDGSRVCQIKNAITSKKKWLGS